MNWDFHHSPFYTMRYSIKSTLRLQLIVGFTVSLRWQTGFCRSTASARKPATEMQTKYPSLMNLHVDILLSSVLEPPLSCSFVSAVCACLHESFCSFVFIMDKLIFILCTHESINVWPCRRGDNPRQNGKELVHHNVGGEE